MTTLGIEPILIVPPVQWPVLPQEVVAFGRLGDQAQMEVVQGLIEGATKAIEQYTGLGLLTQTWVLPLASFSESEIILPKRPLQGVVGVSYLDSEGVLQELTTTSPAYSVSGIGAERTYGTIKNTSWPVGNGVEIRFTVGFGDDPKDVPSLIRQSIILMATTWYDIRLDARVNQDMPAGSTLMVDYWRLKALA
jgi:uncharacterized phiE125 gp8 family phage protein